MIERFRRYMKSRSLRRGVDIYSAMKAWGSPFPVEIIKVSKPYINYDGWCLDYNFDRKSVYFNLATEVLPSLMKARTVVKFPYKNECYDFSSQDLLESLSKISLPLKDYAKYIYAHECAHKFLSIDHAKFNCHCVSFSIVNSVLLMRLGLKIDDVIMFYNFHDEWQACYAFKRYGPEATLKALKLLVNEAASEINDSYVNTADCCKKAVKYDCISSTQNLIIKWAAYYKKQIIKERFERWGLRVLWVVIFYIGYRHLY